MNGAKKRETKYMVKKIVVIGPESTGKSTLCTQLAAHYHTIWVPEYARDYLLTNGADYSFENLLTIAKGQLALEDNLIKTINKTTVFIDTDMYVMKVWCEYVFNKCHQFIIDEIVAREYDLYLLCNVDLPWTKDALREYPDEGPRIELFNMYKDILANQNTPWAIISGTETERLNNTIQVINTTLKL